MPLSNMDHQKTYYYVICVMAFFVLMWGAIDLASSSMGLISIKASGSSYVPADEETAPPAQTEEGEQFIESYYQKKMLTDRFWDSLARVFISGAIFSYSRFKTARLEAKA